jgi:hypothetical protein
MQILSPAQNSGGGVCLFGGGGGEEISLPRIRGTLIVIGQGAGHTQMRPKGSPHELTRVPRLRRLVRQDDGEVLRQRGDDRYLWHPDTQRNQGAGTVGHALHCGEILRRDQARGQGTDTRLRRRRTSCPAIRQCDRFGAKGLHANIKKSRKFRHDIHDRGEAGGDDDVRQGLQRSRRDGAYDHMQ